MVLVLADIVSMARQRKNFNDLMLELSGISGKTPRFLTREQIERIREEAGTVSHETLRERAFREYVEFCDRVQRQIHAVNRAITRALIKSSQRLKEAREAGRYPPARHGRREGPEGLPHGGRDEGVHRRRREADSRRNGQNQMVLIPGEAAHRNEMMSPVVTE